MLEHFIFSGAFDVFPGNRAQKYAELATIMDLALEQKKMAATGQLGLFGALTALEDSPVPTMYQFQQLPDWDNKEKLEREKEVIGFYLSAHPLDAYQPYRRWLSLETFESARTHAAQASPTHEVTVICCGLLKTSKVIMTKKNDRMAFVQLEDTTSGAEIIIFPKLFQRVEQWLDTHQVFIVKGALDLTSQQKCKIKANEFIPIELFFEQWPTIERALVHIPHLIPEAEITALSQHLTGGKTPLDILFEEDGTALRLRTQKTIHLSREFMLAVEKAGMSIQIKL